MHEVISLREFIDNKNKSGSVKIRTFCRLMKDVSSKIEKDERSMIRINLDEIKININTGEIILPDNLFVNPGDLDKTITGFNTGISLMADRKSTLEHKRVSFALMVLGWYCNPDGESVMSDIQVLENFEEFMSNVPNWLHEYFINIFRKMNYDMTFDKYYDEKFTNKVRKDIEDVFAPYNLSEEQFNKVAKLVVKTVNKNIEEGVYNA